MQIYGMRGRKATPPDRALVDQLLAYGEARSLSWSGIALEFGVSPSTFSRNQDGSFSPVVRKIILSRLRQAGFANDRVPAPSSTGAELTAQIQKVVQELQKLENLLETDRTVDRRN